MATPASRAAAPRWDLTDLYRGPDDPRIAGHQRKARARARRFAATHRGKVRGLSAAELARAVKELEAISTLMERPLIHAHLRFAANTTVPAHGAALQQARDAQTSVDEHLIFFRLEWIALPAARAGKLLRDPALARYRHLLAHLRQAAPYVLGEAEEKVLDLKAGTGRRALHRLFDETVGAMTARVNGKHRPVPLQEALAGLYSASRAERAAAAKGVSATLRQHARLLTFLFNTLLADHADDDRLRGRPHPMAARNLDNEIDQPQVDALLAACDRHMPLVARYYTLKRKLLGLKRLTDYDRYAPIGGGRPPRPFTAARDTVLAAYRDFSPHMAEVAGRFFTGRWIDAEVRPGKMAGAFSAAGLPEGHPYILLNYTGSPRDVMVLAHELGHGVHQYLARPQGMLQFNSALTTAETASVFGEMLTFHRLLAEERDPRARLELLCGKVEDIFLTVSRQAAMTRFEQRLHQARREQGELTTEAISELWMAANRAMFGDAVTLTEDYALWWSYVPHFVHSPFYCYAYCFGELLVLALYRRYEEEGRAFVPKYVKLLAAGGSASPAELLKPLGVDTARPEFWETGFTLLEELVGQAEALAASLPAR